MPKKKAKMRLPNKILALPNPDKLFHENWYKGRNMLNIPHPWRCVALGPPNVGKTTIVKNLLLRADPPFEEVVVIHCDGGYTKEYDDLGESMEMLSEIPAPEDWDGIKKTLVVLDDLEFKGMNKGQKRNLDRLFGYCSTHKNISVILCSQDAFNVPPIVRRCSNLWVLWRCPDLDAMATCARKTGMQASGFNSIFNHLMCEHRDSLWLDTTAGSPYPMRKNGFELIEKKDGTDTKKAAETEDKFSTK
jgi:hypothetical protein